MMIPTMMPIFTRIRPFRRSNAVTMEMYSSNTGQRMAHVPNRPINRLCNQSHTWSPSIKTKQAMKMDSAKSTMARI